MLIYSYYMINYHDHRTVHHGIWNDMLSFLFIQVRRVGRPTIEVNVDNGGFDDWIWL